MIEFIPLSLILYHIGIHIFFFHRLFTYSLFEYLIQVLISFYSKGGNGVNSQSGSVPTCCQATGSPCGCQPKRRSLLQDGSPKVRSASQQRDLAASQTHGMLGALVDRSDNLLMKAAADVDEIDMASSDTFLPWSPEFFEADPLSKLHILCNFYL
jgi:hypothetical protein